MARKRIGIFMSEITQVFQTSCGKAIIDLASLRDLDVVIFASYGSYTSPYGRNLLAEIGKKNILHIPDYSDFEAIIALPGSFDIKGMDKEFYELARANATCPVICLQTGHPDFYTISIENKNSMYQMTRHFIDVHHFTDICYMSDPTRYLKAITGVTAVQRPSTFSCRDVFHILRRSSVRMTIWPCRSVPNSKIGGSGSLKMYVSVDLTASKKEKIPLLLLPRSPFSRKNMRKLLSS